MYPGLIVITSTKEGDVTLQAENAITTERLVSEPDYIDLNRLVIERG